MAREDIYPKGQNFDVGSGLLIMKVWTTTDFDGHWPVGVAAVVVAEDEESAEMFIRDALAASCIPQDDSKKIAMVELPIVDGEWRILCDGNY